MPLRRMGLFLFLRSVPGVEEPLALRVQPDSPAADGNQLLLAVDLAQALGACLVGGDSVVVGGSPSLVPRQKRNDSFFSRRGGRR